ncbi:lipid droplet-associated hydrolase [Anoplophora glabripennis]|uniref:lipid droplet-associated hydrolase n=1 Tax=Anoplophora glabripennis TaxID=217634 RepID=UPI0008746D9E|nr:lipid droplet-associated hydrolase [Anoplophora glabripennis]
MHEAFLNLNGVRTKVSTWGRWVEESSEGQDDIVLIITGNPGINGFYNNFAKTIHEKLGYPVWCLGHAGHDLPKETITLPKFKEHQELYGLKEQVQHKADFLEKYIPKNAKIHLVGHSVGSYMILELLDHPALRDKVVDVYLLFPAIEHMAETNNGKFLTNFIKPIVPIIVFLSWIFTFLPNIVQFFLIYVYTTFIMRIHAKQHIKNIKALIKPGVLRRVFFLAFEELDQIRERNNEVIKKNVNKIKIYYGRTDGWAPLIFCDRIKRDIPDVDVEITDYHHTFVLNSSFEVGDKVSTWIKEKK